MNYRILHYNEVDSTNDLAIQYAEYGANSGLVFMADYQRNGRGRFNRVWQSVKGKDLLFSIILRPKSQINRIPVITYNTAKILGNVLRNEYRLDVSIKRPNDLMFEDKKVAGVLTESVVCGEKARFVVVGVGLNVNSSEKELPDVATSLHVITGRYFNRHNILNSFLNHFRKYVC